MLKMTDIRPNRHVPVDRKFRSDIQVLRAFAVVVVVLDHIFGSPSGGFVGVDVFFVISGFLITGHLLNEGERSGSISLVDFYRKRMRRLLPAAMSTIIVTTISAYFLFNSARWLSTAWDALYSTIFLANWRFASTGSDYFQADGPISPLRHFWSLSVEEQFYVVWPVLLIISFAITKIRNWPTRYIALPFVALTCVASLVWARNETLSTPTVAYYSTFSRAWELGVGAFISIIATNLNHVNILIRTVLAWAGIFAIFISLFVIGPSSDFPFPGALLPVFGAAAFLAAGTGGEPLWTRPMNNVVLVYIGNTSYSLYLWHFPVIMLYQAYFGIDSVSDYLLILAWIGFLSANSYHFIEKPVLSSNFLLPRHLRSKRKSMKLRRTMKHGREWVAYSTRRALTLFLIGMVVCLSFTVIRDEQRTVEELTALARISEPIITTSTPLADTESAQTRPPAVVGPQISADIDQALIAAEWPNDLHPSIDDALRNDTYPTGVGGCGSPVQVGQCNFGNESAPKTVFIVGDSVAMKWAGGLLGTFANDQWKMRIRAMFACPFINLRPTLDEAKDKACSDRKQNAIKEINDSRPDLVLIINTAVMPTLSTTNQKATPTQWQEGTRVSLESLTQSASKLVVVSPPPPDKDVKVCYSPNSSPAMCVSRITDEYSSNVKYTSKAVNAVAGAIYLDTRYLFCNEAGACPAFAGGMALKRDRTHPTLEYIQKIQPTFADMLASAGAL